MDVVRAFNNELSSLYEGKPPVSKARMTQVTKAAIKGIKFYKHIVQSVEKFIQKCRPEYKIPGLYVIDSIVRQSKHQFSDKDVFAPRFSKNITTTFQNLFKCPDEDRPRIVRVLNLWQKNSVFPSEIIQPLLDLANPNMNINQSPGETESYERNSAKPRSSTEIPVWKGWKQSRQGNESFLESGIFINSELNTTIPAVRPEVTTVKFNKKLLDFDYGDEEDEKQEETNQFSEPNALALSMAQNLLSNPELLQQLQQMQQTIQQNEVFKADFSMLDNIQEQKDLLYPQQASSELPFPNDHQLPEHPPHATVFGSSSLSYIPEPPPYLSTGQGPGNNYLPVNYKQPPLPPNTVNSEQDDSQQSFGMINNISLPLEDQDERNRALNSVMTEDKDEREKSLSPSRSKPRSSRRHSRRSRSRSPRRQRSRSGSRSRSHHKRDRSRSRSRERERRKKGLPPIKKGYLCVCSTTLWLGHIPKIASEANIYDVFAEFGTIASIDMIVPRGCVYVCMDRRQDAYKALQSLKNLKLHGSAIKMAWAPGKGVKGKEYKDFWEVGVGVSYIPYHKIPDDVDLDALEDGGVVDDESVPENLKEQQRTRQKEKEEARKQAEKDLAKNREQAANHADSSLSNTVGGLPPVNMQVVPQIVQPHFGIAVPGIMPTQSVVMPMTVGIPQNSLVMIPPNTQPMQGGHWLPPIPSMAAVSTCQQLQALSTVQSLCISTFPVHSTADAISQSMDLSGDATPTEEEGTCLPLESNSVNSQHITSTTTTTSGNFSLLPHIPSLSNHSNLSTVSSVEQPSSGVPPPVHSTIPQPVGQMPFLPSVGGFQQPARPPGQFQTGMIHQGLVSWGPVNSQLPPPSTVSTENSTTTVTVAALSQFGSPHIPCTILHPPTSGLGPHMSGPYQGQGHNGNRMPNLVFSPLRHPSLLASSNLGVQQQSLDLRSPGNSHYPLPGPSFQSNQLGQIPTNTRPQEQQVSESALQQRSSGNERKVLLSPPKMPPDLGPRTRGPLPPEHMNFPPYSPLLNPVRGPPPHGFPPRGGPRPRMEFVGSQLGGRSRPRGPSFDWNRPHFAVHPDRMRPRPGFLPREFFEPHFGRAKFDGRFQDSRERMEQAVSNRHPIPYAWQRGENLNDHDWSREKGRYGRGREHDHWKKDNSENDERDFVKSRNMNRNDRQNCGKTSRDTEPRKNGDHAISKSSVQQTGASTNNKAEDEISVQENGQKSEEKVEKQ
ncbi:protein SCAF8-like isoform X2 [Limulus polyphemus]|uniref:Protein SCAF8-like isoform X2 n=1 Tax=Limulus polyphemus TaxID=6850 RepID=A0ABM1SM78_LIMPO|nr:protein SCAF8-like isoform X2 [Limulus polyphemus]